MSHPLTNQTPVDYVNFAPEEIKRTLTERGISGIASVSKDAETGVIMVEGLDWTEIPKREFTEAELYAFCTLQGDLSTIHSALEGVHSVTDVGIYPSSTLNWVGANVLIESIKGNLANIHPALAGFQGIMGVGIYENGSIEVLNSDSSGGIRGEFSQLHLDLANYDRIARVQFGEEGVVCDVYSFDTDDSKDLGIVRVRKGYKTPLQRVLKGNKTLEIFQSGAGTLSVKNPDGVETKHTFPADAPNEVEIKVGDLVQWEATEDLVFAEICYQPHQDGRFENINE